MSLLDKEYREEIVKYIRDSKDRIDINSKLFDILEGAMDEHLKEKLIKDLGEKSGAAAMARRSPINYYLKVIDKMTSIYNHGVVRKVVGGTEQDAELLAWYEEELGINKILNHHNESLNAYKYALLNLGLSDPDYLGTRHPFIRTIPNNQFLVLNNSRVDPTSPDIIILFMGKKGDRYIYHVYSNDEFVIMDGNGDLIREEMAVYEMDGSNPYGVMPFEYANLSHNLVMPKLQVDDLQMALLIPLMLTDLGYAVKFQAFSMFVATDIDAQNIEISPNVVLHLKSDPTGEKPSFDTIKPDVDIQEVLNLASSQISLWLSSKGIRPGAIATGATDQFSSGISKMIDESDTYESRKKQIEVYKEFESCFWDKLLNVFHPVWVADGLIDNRTIFSPAASVVTEFQDPQPLKTVGEKLSELKEAIDLGLESRKGAMKVLHPDWDDEDIEAKLSEIDEEAKAKVESMMQNMVEIGNGGPAGNQDEGERPSEFNGRSEA